MVCSADVHTYIGILFVGKHLPPLMHDISCNIGACVILRVASVA